MIYGLQAHQSGAKKAKKEELELGLIRCVLSSGAAAGAHARSLQSPSRDQVLHHPGREGGRGDGLAGAVYHGRVLQAVLVRLPSLRVLPLTQTDVGNPASRRLKIMPSYILGTAEEKIASGKDLAATFIKMLTCIKGVTESLAKAIVREYPTLRDLYESYAKCRSELDRREMLIGIFVRYFAPELFYTRLKLTLGRTVFRTARKATRSTEQRRPRLLERRRRMRFTSSFTVVRFPFRRLPWLLPWLTPSFTGDANKPL